MGRLSGELRVTCPSREWSVWTQCWMGVWRKSCAAGGLEVLAWQRQLPYPLFHNLLASLDKTSCCFNEWPLTLRGRWRAEPCASWAGVWSLHRSGLCILHLGQPEQHCSVSVCLICPGGQSSEPLGLKWTGMGCSSKILLSFPETK